MARTKLFRLMQQAYATVRGAARAKVPVDEYLEMKHLSRREVLKVSGATAALAMLPAAGCDNSMMANKSVAIVGGGMAGLLCAYRLKQKGVMATVYEASTSRAGGRMFSERTIFPDNMHVELGGELIDTGHTTMRNLATELGIELYDYQDEDASLTDTFYINGGMMTVMDVLAGFAPIAASIDAANAAITNPDEYITYANANGAEALDALSIKGWLDSVNAAGPVRTLLEVAYNIEYGLEVDQQSSLNLLQLISTDTSLFHIFGDSDERFHTKTGNDTYITKLVGLLDAAQINMGHMLVAATKAADGRFKLTFMKGAGTVEASFDHVVFALPFTLLRAVDLTGLALPAIKTKAITELGYGTNAKLMLGFSSRPWRTAKSNGTIYTNLAEVQTTWETSRLQPGASGILTDFTGGNLGVAIGNGTPESQRDTAVTALDKVFPGMMAASNGKVARMHWPTYPLTKGSYSCYKVGQWTGIAGAEIERVGNLHFAGEHTSLDSQGYMEGAAATGEAAAMEVLANLGIS